MQEPNRDPRRLGRFLQTRPLGMSALVKTGVTSWADRSLVASDWYPPAARTPAARLAYYASRFGVVENDMPYYAIPQPAQAARWSACVPRGFTMNVKAFAPLTGHYTDPRRLPPDLRQDLPAELRHRPRIYPRHLGPARMAELEARFVAALAPLAAGGTLGVVLFQYPVWFPRTRANLEELARVQAAFAPYRVAIELRNATWMSARHRQDTLSFLRAHGLVYTCVDEPQGFVSSVPPIAAATAEIALVRLHGRNAARWNRAARTAGERFDYLYDPAELADWVPPVLRLADQTREVHVLFNNCHQDYAVRNATQMSALIARAQHAAEISPAPH